MQLGGTAEVIGMDNEDGKKAFAVSMVLRRSFELERVQVEGKAVFIRIRPAPVIFTYGIGLSVFELMRNIGGASARVTIPTQRL